MYIKKYRLIKECIIYFMEDSFLNKIRDIYEYVIFVKGCGFLY